MAGQKTVRTIADDGYGRFTVTRGGQETAVPLHRYAVALALGVPVRAQAVIEHVVCDNPVCVQTHPDPLLGHIWSSTQSENRRAERAERSRQLAVAVRDGGDDAAVRAVLLRIGPAHTTLF